MEGKIPMAARRHVTNKLRTAYARASKSDRSRILDEVMAATGMARSTARRMLTGPVLPDPAEQVDRRRLRPKGYGDDSRRLLEHVWALMGCPCGKYLVVMLPEWLPLMQAAGDLDDRPFATAQAVAELEAMSPATIDRYLAPARVSMRLRGISTTKPSPLLRNSIGLSKVGDEPATVPGVVEADTVAHCGPTFAGEFARTLTMTDLVTGWTENTSIRNNASRWIVGGVAELQTRFPSRCASSTATTDRSSSTTTSPTGSRSATSPRPAHARTRRTTRPPWSPRTTMSCASTRSTGATTQLRSSPCSASCGRWSRYG